MNKTLKYFLLLMVVGSIAFLIFSRDHVILSPGAKAPDDPIQKKVDKLSVINLDDYLIRPLAEFNIKAKVLGKESYSSGRESDLSPYDFALGWGQMSDQSIVDKISISQRRRWYYWRAAQLPIPKRDIETHSANMHIIPSDNDVENILDDVICGQIIELSGFLVFVSSNDGWHWKSSLTRNDIGNGACEVVYVKNIRILEGQ